MMRPRSRRLLVLLFTVLSATLISLCVGSNSLRRKHPRISRPPQRPRLLPPLLLPPRRPDQAGRRSRAFGQLHGGRSLRGPDQR